MESQRELSAWLKLEQIKWQKSKQINWLKRGSNKMECKNSIIFRQIWYQIKWLFRDQTIWRTT